MLTPNDGRDSVGEEIEFGRGRERGMMRNLAFVSLLVSMPCLFLSANDFQVETHQQFDNRIENEVSLRIEVVGQSYCHVDDESFSARLGLRLRFTNSSDHSVILARKLVPPEVVRVARDADAGHKGDFLYAPNPDYFVNKLPNAPRFGDAPDPKLFVVLSPGESFETVGTSGVFGANDVAKAHRGGLLAKGSYVLQVGVTTWPYDWPNYTSKVTSQELRKRWLKYGNLVAGLVYSNFAQFNLPEHFENPPCP